MKVVRYFVVLCCAALVAHSASGQGNSKREKTHAPALRKTEIQGRVTLPNVFLITIDTLRADHVHCYADSNIETPAIDAIAKDGVRFTQAFTPSPITNSSHTSILTGLMPSSHGVTDFAVPLASTHATWAELVKAKGYHTAAFIGAVILDSNSLSPGLDRGFGFYDNFPEHSESRSRWGRVERRGMDVVGRAEKWLSAHPSGPRFVWVHLYDPHDPYEPPLPYSQIYKDRLYDGEIAYADSALGDFVAYLKSHGWYENAIVVVVGDHGEGLGEHGENTHGIFLYDSTAHVPLIIKTPGSNRSTKVVDAQVRTIDILPTVIDLLNIRTQAAFDGESLKAYLSGGVKTDRAAFGETDYPLRFGWAPLRSVRADGFKLIDAPRPEFYDLKNDPGELKNAYAPQRDGIQKFNAMLADLKAKAPPSVAGASPLPDPKDKIQEQNLLHLAMMASEDNRPEDARAALQKVLAVDAKSPTALRQLGELELQSGDYSKAAEHLKGARDVRREDATAALYEGQAREKMGDLAGARDALETSLKLTPGQLQARILLGRVYLGLKDPKAAADQFEAASLLDPNSVDAQMGLAQAQIADGNAGAAVDQLHTLETSQDKNPEFWELLAQGYKSLSKQDEAQRAEDRAKALRGGPKQ
jgi:choline-sulfatase